MLELHAIIHGKHSHAPGLGMEQESVKVTKGNEQGKVEQEADVRLEVVEL